MLIFKKEKRVVELVNQHVALTDACLKRARDTLEIYCGGDLESMLAAAEEVNALETEADHVERSIREVLYSGAYLPEIRSDIYRLVDRVDFVAGNAEDCASFLATERPHIPEEFQADLTEIFAIAVACYHELARAMKTFLKPKGKFEKLQKRFDRVGILESEADAKEVDTLTRIFASDLELPIKLHLAEFVKMVARIANEAENASDLLMFTALKSQI